MKRKSPIEQSAKLSQEESPETLKRRIKELEKQLSNAEMRAEAYKTMIEVAESMGMPVRKKLPPNDRNPAHEGPFPLSRE